MYKLKELREKANMTQAELAEHIGISQQAIGMYEQERREPSFEKLAKMADFFGVSADLLIGRQEHEVISPMRVTSPPQYPNNKFRQLRIERNLTQAELLQQYNQRYNRTYSIPALSLFENGRRMPELPALMDFARFFNCSLDYLVGLEQEVTLGDRLSAARKKAELTQPEVEAHTGINFKTISDWENNVSVPSSNDIIALCYLYDVSADDLLGVRRTKCLG